MEVDLEKSGNVRTIDNLVHCSAVVSGENAQIHAISSHGSRCGAVLLQQRSENHKLWEGRRP